MTGIYMIQNSINNKIYIGKTKDLNKRWKRHKRYLKGNYHYNKNLQEEWNEYGEENFKYIILCKCNEEKLNELEEYYIFELMSYDKRVGYNKKYGGNSEIPTTETKYKLSESQKGEKNGMYNKKHTQETKNKIGEAGKKRIGSLNCRSKSVLCIELNKIFGSTREAERELGICNSCIAANCRGEQKSAGKLNGTKLHWKYI